MIVTDLGTWRRIDAQTCILTDVQTYRTCVSLATLCVGVDVVWCGAVWCGVAIKEKRGPQTCTALLCSALLASALLCPSRSLRLS